MTSKIQMILDQAKENTGKLFDLHDPDSTDRAKEKLVGMAWENECEIERLAKETLVLAERIARNVGEAMDFLSQGCVDHINGCGVLQHQGSEFDTAILKLQMQIKTRRFYADLINP